MTEFPDITHEELTKAIRSRTATLIDVNGSESYRQGHIPGAIDYVADKDRLAAKLPKDKNALIVAYCGGPQCNAYRQGAEAAAKLGYTNVRHYTPGISGWRAAKAQVETVAV